jgi:TRAP-type C4-dicarboxylate transport system permease small subunit
MGLERFSELLRRGMMIAGGVSLLALTLLATANVALRIFRVPASGTYEVVSFLGAIVTAGALGHTQKRKDQGGCCGRASCPKR